MALRVAAALIALPVLGLAALGAHGLLTGARPPMPLRTEEVVIPPPSRALPREWTATLELKEMPTEFRWEWAADCPAARLSGTTTMWVTARSLFGQPINWIRIFGRRVLVNTGPQGASTSTQIRSDGLALYLEERYSEVLGAARAPYALERPLILAKCP